MHRRFSFFSLASLASLTCALGLATACSQSTPPPAPRYPTYYPPAPPPTAQAPAPAPGAVAGVLGALAQLQASLPCPPPGLPPQLAAGLAVDGPFVLDILSSELSSPSVDYALLDPSAASKHGAYGMG